MAVILESAERRVSITQEKMKRPEYGCNKSRNASRGRYNKMSIAIF